MSTRNGSRASGSGGRGETPGPVSIAQRVCSELAELLQHPAEGVVSLERTDDGWRVGVEVVEVRRIPETADVMAEYEVDADQDGQLAGYRRVRRYARGAVEADR